MRRLHLDVDAYVALDRASEEKWEYANGEALAKASAPVRHAAIVTHLVLALGRSPACLPLVGQKVETTRTGAYHYPDLVVICGKPRYGARDEHALINPTLLVEVLSPSTADYDRGAKFDHYKSIPELTEYLVVFTDERRVEHRRRVSEAQWLTTDVIGGSVQLDSIGGVSITLEEIYADLDRIEP